MFWDVDKIRHIREEKHITREKLATMTGIPIQTLADWEQLNQPLVPFFLTPVYQYRHWQIGNSTDILRSGLMICRISQLLLIAIWMILLLTENTSNLGYENPWVSSNPGIFTLLTIFI